MSALDPGARCGNLWPCNGRQQRGRWRLAKRRYSAMSQALEILRMDRFRIGDWLVEPALNQLSRGSKVERVEPKSVEVLLALAHHAGQVMSRDQLIAEVWNGIAVSDDALTQS